MARRTVPTMVVVAMVLVACGDRIGEPTMRTASPDEARCATSPFTQDPAVKVVAVFSITPTALAVRDEQRLNSPNSPGVIRSKWRDRPPGERLLLCWYEGPIGIPGGRSPPADRFVIVLGDDLVQFLAAGTSTSLPISSDPP